jgi:hypothetical protein
MNLFYDWLFFNDLEDSISRIGKRNYFSFKFLNLFFKNLLFYLWRTPFRRMSIFLSLVWIFFARSQNHIDLHNYK